MNTCLVVVAIYLVLCVAVLLLNRVVRRYRQAPKQQPGAEELIESGFVQNNAWNELDAFITRSQRGNPLH